MPSHNLISITGADMESRFLVDGVRVSHKQFDDILARAYAFGRVDCFHTRGKQLPGGKIRRWNYSRATY